MIGIVVGYQERFAKQSLSVTMRDLAGEVPFGVGDQLMHGLQIGQNLLYAFVPGLLVGRSFALGPVLLRPFWRFMFSGAAELKDVPLGNADMFQQLPRCVRTAFRLAAAKFTGKVLQGLAQINMRFCLGKQIGNVLADWISFLHGN